jgi:hypothetical protein
VALKNFYSTLLKLKKMKQFSYSVSTNTIWASFDFGYVVAENIEEARILAEKKLSEDFKKANEALAQNKATEGFIITCDMSQIVMEETKFKIVQ